jgi:hypothetical protein
VGRARRCEGREGVRRRADEPAVGRSSVADEGLQPGDRASLVSDPSRVGTVLEWRGEDRVAWREDGQEVERKMRLIDEALGKKAAPKISLEGWVYGAEGARTVKPSATTPPSTPVPEVDAAKDKALIDAFSAAVAAALGGT